jgi:SAM-dependent methyltransferase
VRSFERSMAAGIGPIAESVSVHLPELLRGLGGGRRVRWLDVGGGDGSLAAHLCESRTDLTVDVFNLGVTRDVFEARRASSSAAPRVGFVAGDFIEGGLPSGYDVLSFVRVLHDWPSDVARSLLRKAHAALAPGARLVICEELRTADRLAIQFFWSYFLIGVDGCHSRLREAELYLAWLEAEGFAGARVLPGAFDVIVAERV